MAIYSVFFSFYSGPQCHGPFYNGQECEGSKFETDACSTVRCPIDGVWREWSSYSECSTSCGPGVITRARECVEPLYGGEPCPGEASETQKCELLKCPIDGVWNEWQPWGDCLVTCGGGDQYRFRTCILPTFGGRDCMGENRETRRCGLAACGKDGEWSEWGEWRACDCRGKVQRRYRECVGREGDGMPCPGLHRDERDCVC